MSCDGSRPEDLATKWGISGKELRKWLREKFASDANLLGTNWLLTHQQVESARKKYGPAL